MWGTSPLIPTELAFPFLLLSCFSSLPAKLLVSLCSFLLCRLMFRINAGGVLCRAGGSPTCLCLPLPPSLPLALCLGEVPPCAAFRALLAGVEGPSSQKLTVHSPIGQRQDWASPGASCALTASSSYFRLPCSLLLEAGVGDAAQGAPSRALCVTSRFLSVGLVLELRQLPGSEKREGRGPSGRHGAAPLTPTLLGLS